jgi:hypothetical protein
MLGFFSNKSDHPLANLKSAQQLLEALPKTDSVEVLHEVGHWIESLFDSDNEFRADHQFAVLRMLDEAAHPHLRKISQSYFAVVPPNPFQENRLWGAMHEYLGFCSQGYLHLLRAVRAGEKGSSALKPNMPLIIARGMYALFRRVECMKVRYAQIDAQCWLDFADLYEYAEGLSCQDEILQVYMGGANSNISIKRLFASMLTWHSVAVGAFKPLDLHIAKNSITHISKYFAVTESNLPGSLFVFDLARPSSPMRLLAEGAQYPLSMRFVSTKTPPGYIDNLLKTLDKNLIPDEFNLDVVYSAALVADVLRRLAVFFQESLPVRRHQRRKIQMSIQAANGFLPVLEQAEAGLNLLGVASDVCAVEDMSSGGLRFVLAPDQSIPVTIGSLVSLKPENTTHCGVGIVRRLRRDMQGGLHVGVKMLASKVEVVLLYGNDNINPASLALSLESAEVQEGECCLLMPSDTYSQTRSPTMRQGDESYLLLPLTVIEKGMDFDLVRYRKMLQDSSADEADY